MVKINQNIFDLADGRVALVDLAADELAGSRAPGQCGLVDTRYRRCRLAVLLSFMA